MKIPWTKSVAPSQLSVASVSFSSRGFVQVTRKKNTFFGQVGYGCGSKLNRRGKPQVVVHVSTYQGSILVPVF